MVPKPAFLRSGAALAALLASPALADPAGGWHHGPHGAMWGGGWLGMGVGLIAMLLFWAAVIAVAVLAVRWLIEARARGGAGAGAGAGADAGGGNGSVDSGGGGEDEALRILRQRFARGEIDEAEFQERRRVLEG